MKIKPNNANPTLKPALLPNFFAISIFTKMAATMLTIGMKNKITHQIGHPAISSIKIMLYIGMIIPHPGFPAACDDGNYALVCDLF